jgi:hypothetical protein
MFILVHVNHATHVTLLCRLQITFSRLSDAGVAQRMFIDYLIDNVAGASRPPRIQV